MKLKKKHTVQEIANIIGCKFIGEESHIIEGINEIHVVENGEKYRVNLLKSSKGFSEMISAFPFGHSTSLSIKIVVASLCSALS